MPLSWPETTPATTNIKLPRMVHPQSQHHLLAEHAMQKAARTCIQAAF
jgi:hypothetical protein